MLRFVRIIVVFLCAVGFLFIRFRESELFYDPLICFFKGNYQVASLPEIDAVKLYLNLSLRYGVHMVLSLFILWAVFLEKGILKFAVVLYGFVFVALLIVLGYFISTYSIGQATSVFYVRRFLIQPLLILILVPAFYYYRKVND